jgi:hypothetical protein
VAADDVVVEATFELVVEFWTAWLIVMACLFVKVVENGGTQAFWSVDCRDDYLVWWVVVLMVAVDNSFDDYSFRVGVVPYYFDEPVYEWF